VVGTHEGEMCIGGPSKYCGTEGTAKMISVFDVNVGNMGLMHILLSFVSTENQRAYSPTPWMPPTCRIVSH
jgi:hypothetical protein